MSSWTCTKINYEYKLTQYINLLDEDKLLQFNATTNEKRKQFDREILLAIDEFLKVIGYEETPPAQLKKK